MSNRLKFWRIERGLSQIELANASAVPRYEIQLIEQGIRIMSKDVQEMLSVALGIEPSDLIEQAPQGHKKAI